MAISTYDEIKGAVNAWLLEDTKGREPDFIRLAELSIYRRLRARAMEVALSFTIAVDGTGAIPSDYIELKHARIVGADTVYPLSRLRPDTLYARYPVRSALGIPIEIARDGEVFVFGPAPDTQYQVQGRYYRALPALSQDNQSNWLSVNGGDLLLFGALIEAEGFGVRDSRVPLWRDKFEARFNELNRQERDEDLSGSAGSSMVHQ